MTGQVKPASFLMSVSGCASCALWHVQYRGDAHSLGCGVVKCERIDESMNVRDTGF